MSKLLTYRGGVSIRPLTPSHFFLLEDIRRIVESFDRSDSVALAPPVDSEL